MSALTTNEKRGSINVKFSEDVRFFPLVFRRRHSIFFYFLIFELWILTCVVLQC